MKENTDEPKTESQTGENAPVKNWLDDATDVEFDITYLGIPGARPVKWFCKILQTSEEKEIRQKHFAQTSEKQLESRHAYNVEMLSRVASRPPENLPGFDEMFAIHDGDLQKTIYAILISATPARIMLANDSLNYYTTINQPMEFYSGLKS